MTNHPVFHLTKPTGEVADSALFGMKGSGLSEMINLGFPVPPGFVLSADLGPAIAAANALSDDVRGMVSSALAELEKHTSRQFGGVERPLLLAIRSGAAISMPGMMDTILNLGLNDVTVQELEKETGDSQFAWDSYRRFIQNFALVVFDIDTSDFEDVLDDLRQDEGVETEAELSAAALKSAAQKFLSVFEAQTGNTFPQDPKAQLEQAVCAVFKSWNSKRAKHFRQMNGFDEKAGTAAVVQAMVFGNLGERSCTGVYFTRNPSTGEKIAYGEYMPRAQGEDVVSGIRTPMELTEVARVHAFSDNPSLESFLPDVFEELIRCGDQLERHFGDMQEIEFTVEQEKLYLLQTRSGKRSSQAALKIVVDMVDEDLITKDVALGRIDPPTLNSMLVSKVDVSATPKLFAKGLPASPGAATGVVVFSSADAVDQTEAGHSVVLVRPETDPRDIRGIDAAAGILTARGGMTSHAAVVARGMGKPCITAAMSLKIDMERQQCSSGGQVLTAGDVITIDGGTGMAYAGEQAVVTPKPEGDLLRMLQWAQE